MDFKQALNNIYTFYRPVYSFNQTFNKNFHMEKHNHSRVELMYARSSYFIFHYVDSNGIDHSEKVYENKLVIINSGLPHYIELPKECKIINLELELVENKQKSININYVLSKNESYVCFANEIVTHSIINSTPIITSLMLSIQAGLSNANAVDYDYLQSLVLPLLLSIGNIFKKDKSSYSYYTNEIVKMYQSDLSKQVNLKEICETLKVSKAYICRQFKLDTGCTIGEYVNKNRIDQAKNLLRNSKSSIIDISDLCGFNNRTTFECAFKKIVGITPKEYRNKSSNKNLTTWLYENNDYGETDNSEYIIEHSK